MAEVGSFYLEFSLSGLLTWACEFVVLRF